MTTFNKIGVAIIVLSLTAIIGVSLSHIGVDPQVAPNYNVWTIGEPI